MCGRFTQNYTWEEVYAFLKMFGNGKAETGVQRVNLSLYSAAMFQVEKRIALGSEDISGAQDVGTAEEDHAVAIGVG